MARRAKTLLTTTSILGTLSSLFVLGMLGLMISIFDNQLYLDTPASTLGEWNQLEELRVIEIVDGDTLKVVIDGTVETIRLIGIDTPETVHPSKPVECFGREASRKLEELVQGKIVHLEADPSQDATDRYGRLLRYVYLTDNTFVNLQMVRDGYAYEYTYKTPYRYQNEFKTAEANAREQSLGLWGPECDQAQS